MELPSNVCDYALAHLLAALAGQIAPPPRGPLLHGGAALRYLYFADARFSPDLDFALRQEASAGDLVSLLDRACRQAGRASGLVYQIGGARHTPRPRLGALTHAWRIVLRRVGAPQPLQPRIGVSFGRQQVLTAPVSLPLLRRYADLPDVLVPAYTLEELVAEKLVALLPGSKPPRPHTVRRKYARHLYDVWFVIQHRKLEPARLDDLLRVKCKQRGLSFRGSDQLVDEFHLTAYRAGWAGLGAITTAEPPDLDRVVAELEALASAMSGRKPEKRQKKEASVRFP